MPRIQIRSALTQQDIRFYVSLDNGESDSDPAALGWITQVPNTSSDQTVDFLGNPLLEIYCYFLGNLLRLSVFIYEQSSLTGITIINRQLKCRLMRW